MNSRITGRISVLDLKSESHERLGFYRHCGIFFVFMYRSGTVNSKSFVGKVLLRIKWKFKLN